MLKHEELEEEIKAESLTSSFSDVLDLGNEIIARILLTAWEVKS